jgi:hypothetical protein
LLLAVGVAADRTRILQAPPRRVVVVVVFFISPGFRFLQLRA